MAKKKVPAPKQYQVTTKFTGWINDKRFDHKKGEIITLTVDEYGIYARFVKEII